ncbi:MAG: HAMP domain-containing histidine kinase, partial [Candidatus Cloacimonetes bacterium]|nr:HAMP domain-containing histidine kinase [Candidatus Cloacimonadota bacterium]
TLSRVLIFHFDITGLKKKEDELRMYKEHLEDLVKERTAELTLSQQQLKKEVDQRILFTHALVHELNTPLTPMLGAGELLANNIKQEPFSAFAKNLNLGIQQLNQRVKDLLDLSRGEAGLLHMRFEIVNVKDVAHQALQYIELEAKSYEQKLQLKIPDNLPMIIADEDRLNQVLLNLISNSIKYSSGPDIILITIRRKGDDIIFSVYDRGIGMDAETLEQSTRPYYQYNENTKGGLGLGLSLCKIIVELHGGKLHITSKKNVGTTVSFSIPINTNKKPL